MPNKFKADGWDIEQDETQAVVLSDDDDDEGPIEQKQNQRIALLVSIIK